MREPKNYAALRATERTAQAERKFAEAGREITQPPEAQPSLEQHVQAGEQPFLSHEERHEVARATLIAELDAQVRGNKINHQERRYELYRFEASGLSVSSVPDQARLSSQGLGKIDHADVAAQHTAAHERLRDALERGGTGQPIDLEPEVSRKPFGIEL